MAVQRVVASIMLLAFSAIYLATMALTKHAYSEILVTIDAFTCVICALNLDNIVAVTRTFPAAATCGWLTFFIFQVYAVYFVAVHEDIDRSAITKIWFQMDCIVAVLSFCVVLTHCVLMCTGGGGGGGGGINYSGSSSSDSDYVAIRVGSNRRTSSRLAAGAAPMPTPGRSARSSLGGLRSKLPSGLAF